MKMLLLVLSLAVYIQLVFSHEIQFTALRFGKDVKSYIHTQPDFTPLKEALSICSWVKRMSIHQDRTQYWLSYVENGNVDEILLADSALTYLFKDETSYTAPALTIGQWNHMCFTWSFATRTKLVYYNGEEIGRETTPSGRKLLLPGTLMFGQYHYSGGTPHSSCCYFGGELYDTNFYSTQLTAGEVKEMFTRGRCANYSQTFGEETFLRWADILLLERRGSVTDVELEECDTDHTHPEDKTGFWQFLRTKNFYNQIISERMLSDMNNRLQLLGEFLNHTVDDALINHLEKHHLNGEPGNRRGRRRKYCSGGVRPYYTRRRRRIGGGN